MARMMYKILLFVIIGLTLSVSCIQKKTEDSTKEPTALKEAELQDSTRLDAANPDSLYPEKRPVERDSTGPGLYRSKGK